MGNSVRNYSKKTLKILFALSGNQCAFPGCTSTLVNEKNALDGNICHIEAAYPGGERFNPSMNDYQRADYNNLILLCPQHHYETNDVKKYPVAVLKEIKRNHESQYLHQQLKRNPSMLKNAINAIASISLEEIQENDSLKPVNPDHKIRYNSIKRNIDLINEYKVYHHRINSLYDELELQCSLKKEKLLLNIRQIYLRIKGKYLLDSDNPMAYIRDNADNIIDDIYDTLYNQMENSQVFNEDIVIGIRLIMVDAFIRCKILEEPS